MRTVPTLCATGAAIGTSALGLSLVTNDTRPHDSRTRPHRDMSLTTTTIFTFSAGNNSSSPLPTAPVYSFTGPEQLPRRRLHRATTSPPATAPPHSTARIIRSVSEDAQFVLKNHDREPRTSLPGVVGRLAEERSSSPLRTPQRRTWLRRLSMSSSRESSRPPSSRPASAAISYSNGSIAPSNTGSSVPMVPQQSAQNLPPNKLVKRSSSIDVKSSPGVSRLPLPTFRRPATSHQRSSMQAERRPTQDLFDHTTADVDSGESRDSQWRLYFTSRVDQSHAHGRRRSSSIPNPIRRIYPDRRYRPTLVSGQEAVLPGEAEYDSGLSSAASSLMDVTAFDHSTASSPIILSSSAFDEQQQTAKRSFSIGDLLSSGPQPLWRSSSRAKVARRFRRRVSSGEMGSTQSIMTDSERPTKRRDVSTDHAPRSLSSAGRADADTARDISDAAARQSLDTFDPSPASSSERRVPSATYSLQGRRGARASTTTSELTSGADSDSEYRSFGDTNTDYQSDVAFDSLPSKATRNSFGRRGPHIDTIFDDTPPSMSSGKSTKLKDFLAQDIVLPEHSHRYSTIEEEESISTPVRSTRDKSIASSPTARAGSRVFSSSPPVMREMPDPDEIDWDAEDMDDMSNAFESHTLGTPLQQRSLALRFAASSKIADGTPSRLPNGFTDRATIFDWSEAQPSPSHNHSPPRPRTVHGKKEPDNRGSRPSTRRPVSGMHARSHSVPIVPDVDGKRTNASNKFGTWGVGSKAVTEDWNEDFDFDESFAETESTTDRRIDSGHEILVPRVIREQQENVVANIGMLREWGLLIEELKELRVRAVALDMLRGSHAQAWSEVDAMIELADQESEEHTLAPRRSPPSSPGFDFSAFEDLVPDLPPPDMSIAARLPEPLLPAPEIKVVTTPPPTSSPNRPRKDSEAVARSVIEALRSRRTAGEPATLQPVPSTRKVPFDTATLRHIVPYVNGLKRKVKDALRETEGLYRSPSAVRHKPMLQTASGAEDTDDFDYDLPDDLDDADDALKIKQAS